MQGGRNLRQFLSSVLTGTPVKAAARLDGCILLTSAPYLY